MATEMTYEEKVGFYATAKRARYGIIHQIVAGDIKRFYVGKLRGKIVSRIGDSQYKFETAAEAKKCAWGFRAHCKELASNLNLTTS